MFHNTEGIIINNFARVVRHAQKVTGLRLEKPRAKIEAQDFAVSRTASFDLTAAPEGARARLVEQRDAVSLGLVRFEPQPQGDPLGVGRNRDASRLTCAAQLRREDEGRDAAARTRRRRFLPGGPPSLDALSLGSASLFGKTLLVV